MLIVYLQSIPQDDQKIRSLLVPGTLYLYQVPPPPIIPPMSEEEESGHISSSHTVESEESKGHHEFEGRGKTIKGLFIYYSFSNTFCLTLSISLCLLSAFYHVFEISTYTIWVGKYEHGFKSTWE